MAASLKLCQNYSTIRKYPIQEVFNFVVLFLLGAGQIIVFLQSTFKIVCFYSISHKNPFYDSYINLDIQRKLESKVSKL